MPNGEGDALAANEVVRLSNGRGKGLSSPNA
jgi:hypothetical protein